MGAFILDDLKTELQKDNPVTKIILFNVTVFLLISLLRILAFLSGESSTVVYLFDKVIENIALPVTINFFVYKPWTLISYMFVHIDLFHIFWNMITLYWFGTILKEYTSNSKIFPVYFFGGIMGAIITIIIFNTILSADQHMNQATLIGASAGVTAIIIAATTLLPNHMINLLFIGSVKLKYIALLIIFIDILDITSYYNMGGNFAHLGGALFGFIYIKQYKKGNDLSIGLNKLIGNIKSMMKFSRKSKMKVAYRHPVSDYDYNTNKIAKQKKIDEILDKISKSGYESLTKEEKNFLFKTSKEN